jgi:NitT/TauT family transport system ATP-binding protein
MAQSPALLPWLTVLENIQISQKINKQYNNQTLSYHDYLELVELTGFGESYPATLSGGMQQRVALARTLAVEASLWLMDEPFAALDEFTREQLVNKVLQLWSTFNPTVIWVTHSIIEAVNLADRILVMSHHPGQLKADLKVEQARPRDITHQDCITLVQELRELLQP